MGIDLLLLLLCKIPGTVYHFGSDAGRILPEPPEMAGDCTGMCCYGRAADLAKQAALYGSGSDISVLSADGGYTAV